MTVRSCGLVGPCLVNAYPGGLFKFKGEQMLIGLSGEMGAGKTTLASLICERHPYIRISFADRFKKSLCALFDWDIDKVNDFDYKQEIDPVVGISRRLIMQKFATDFLRDMIHPDIHIRLTAVAMHNVICDTGRCVIIDDIRQQNEAQFVKDLGGVVIKIHRPENPLPQSNHKVEKQNPPYDYELINSWEPGNMLNEFYKILPDPIKGDVHSSNFQLLDSIFQLLDSIVAYKMGWERNTVQK